MWFWDEPPRPWELVVCREVRIPCQNPKSLASEIAAFFTDNWRLSDRRCFNSFVRISSSNCQLISDATRLSRLVFFGLRQWKRKCLLPSINSVLPVWVFWLANLVTLIQDVSSLSNWARNISEKESLYTWSTRNTLMKFVTIETEELGALTDRRSKVAWSPLPHSFCSKLFLKPWAKMRCQTFVKRLVCVDWDRERRNSTLPVGIIRLQIFKP
jgi:hypothetical protein